MVGVPLQAGLKGIRLIIVMEKRFCLGNNKASFNYLIELKQSMAVFYGLGGLTGCDGGADPTPPLTQASSVFPIHARGKNGKTFKRKKSSREHLIRRNPRHTQPHARGIIIIGYDCLPGYLNVVMSACLAMSCTWFIVQWDKGSDAHSQTIPLGYHSPSSGHAIQLDIVAVREGLYYTSAEEEQQVKRTTLYFRDVWKFRVLGNCLL